MVWQYVVQEITRRVNLTDIWQAAYTAGAVLPKPIATTQYWHRSLNPKKLISVGFSRLQVILSHVNIILIFFFFPFFCVFSFFPDCRKWTPCAPHMSRAAPHTLLYVLYSGAYHMLCWKPHALLVGLASTHCHFVYVGVAIQRIYSVHGSTEPNLCQERVVDAKCSDWGKKVPYAKAHCKAGFGNCKLCFWVALDAQPLVERCCRLFPVVCLPLMYCLLGNRI